MARTHSLTNFYACHTGKVMSFPGNEIHPESHLSSATREYFMTFAENGICYLISPGNSFAFAFVPNAIVLTTKTLPEQATRNSKYRNVACGIYRWIHIIDSFIFTLKKATSQNSQYLLLYPVAYSAEKPCLFIT